MAVGATEEESDERNSFNNDPMQALAIDESLPALQRIKKYINSDIMLHRYAAKDGRRGR